MVEEMGTVEAEHADQAEIERRIGQAKPDDESGSAGMASVSQLFQFATSLDLCLLTAGTLFSGVVGAAQPGMMLLFADLINSVGTLLGGNDVSCPKPRLCPCPPRSLSLSILANRTTQHGPSLISRGPTKVFRAPGMGRRCSVAGATSNYLQGSPESDMQDALGSDVREQRVRETTAMGSC